MFHEASQNRIFQDVVQQIQDAILNGAIKAGDTLPPERDLKTTFNTSRGTLREALRVLEERGLIEIRLGVRGGALVKQVSTAQARQTLGLLIQSQSVSLNHLAEFREGMEGNVAALAARRATTEDMDRLEALLAEAKAHVDTGHAAREAFLDTDKRFHLALAEISRNPVYIFVFHSVHDNIHRYYDQFLTPDRYELKENYRDLKEIARAIREKSGDQARVLAQSHIMRFHKSMMPDPQESDIPK